MPLALAVYKNKPLRILRKLSLRCVKIGIAAK